MLNLKIKTTTQMCLSSENISSQ